MQPTCLRSNLHICNAVLVNPHTIVVKSNNIKRFMVAIMTWLIVMECLVHRWPRLCSTSLSPNITHHQIFYIYNTIGPVVDQELPPFWVYLRSPPICICVRVAPSLVFFLVFCVLSVCIACRLRLTASDYLLVSSIVFSPC